MDLAADVLLHVVMLLDDGCRAKERVVSGERAW